MHQSPTLLVLFLICLSLNPSFAQKGYDENIRQEEQSDRTRLATQMAEQLNTLLYEDRHSSLIKSLQGPNVSPEQRELRDALMGKGSDPKHPKDYNTVAVHINRKDEVFIAANIQTAALPFEKGMLASTDFNLRQEDVSLLVDGVRKFPGFSGKPVHLVETTKKAERQKEMRENHAEMKLLKMREELSPIGKAKRASVIAASKSACGKCHARMGEMSVPHNFEEDGANMRPKNWKDVDEVGEVIKVTVHPGDVPDPKTNLYKQAGVLKKRTANLPQESRKSKVESCPCCQRQSKRVRRDGESSCPFAVEGNQVRELESGQFLEKYARMDEQQKTSTLRQLSVTPPASITGNQTSIKQVNGLLAHSGVKSHVNQINSARQGTSNPADGTQASRNALARQIAAARKKERQNYNAAVSVNSFFLAKNVIERIDVTDGVFIGIGLARISTEFTKLGGPNSTLARVGAPLGGILDAGLSFLSLQKAMARVSSSGMNRFERSVAMSRLVQQTADVTLTALVTVGSTAFPPAAPFLTVAGILGKLFFAWATRMAEAKAHVEELDSRIPLMAWEKDVEMERYLNDQTTSEYLKNLAYEKNANSHVSRQYATLLQNRPELLGIGVPSRDVFFRGGCQWRFRECLTLWNKCDDWETIGFVCSNLGRCEHYPRYNYMDGSCRSFNFEVRKKRPTRFRRVQGGVSKKGTSSRPELIEEFECHCTRSDNITVSGFPYENSVINLSGKARVYEDRAAPNDLATAHFKCKPNSAEDRGPTRSVKNSSPGFQCERAMVLASPFGKTEEEGRQRYWLFDLGNGTDLVTLDPQDTDPSLFLVDDGEKQFVGGGGADQFVVVGSCVGLVGEVDGRGGEGDALVLGEECAKERVVRFGEGRLVGGGLNMTFRNVESLLGRKGEVDVFVVTSCAVRNIVTQGGRSGDEVDVVEILGNGEDCPYNLTVRAGTHARVTSNATFGNVSVIFEESGLTSGTNDFDVGEFYVNANVTTLVTLGMTSVDADVVEWGRNGSLGIFRVGVRSKNSGRGVHLRYFGLEDAFPSVQFSEVVGPVSLLQYEEKQLKVIHTLLENRKLVNPWRGGSNDLPNVFHLVSGPWGVNGSSVQKEIFLLHPTFSGFVDGRGGGDSLHVVATEEGQRSEKVTIEVIHLRRSFIPKDLVGLEVVGVQQVIGRQKEQEEIWLREGAGCEGEGFTVGGRGGGDKVNLLHTRVHVPPCQNPQVKIVAEGHTEVTHEVSVTRGTFRIVVEPEGLEIKGSMNFSLLLKVTELKNPPYWEEYSVVVEQSIEHVTSIEAEVTRLTSSSSHSLALRFLPGQWVNFTFVFSGVPELPTTAFYEGDELTAKIVVDEVTGSLCFVHLLRSPSTKNGTLRNRNAVAGVHNLFLCEEGTWLVDGGSTNSTFHLNSPNFKGTIDGGLDGVNSVLLLPEFLKGQSVDLNFQTGSGHQGALVFKNIHNIFARDGQPEAIVLGCQSSYVSSGGGRPGANDILIIPRGCPSPQVTLNISEHTSVRNSALQGSFTYSLLSSEGIDLDFIPTEKSLHVIQFRFPLSHIRRLTFDLKTLLLRVTLGKSSHNFRMLPISSGKEYFSQPFIQLLDEWVVAELRVASSGVVDTSIEIRDAPAGQLVKGIAQVRNHFYVNMSDAATLHSLEGGDLDDTVWVRSVGVIILLDGGKGEGINELHLEDSFYPESSLVVDLDISYGSVTLTLGETSVSVVSSLRNFHSFFGRQKGHDTVYAGCFTRHVEDAEVIHLTDSSCLAYNLTLVVTSTSKVVFEVASTLPPTGSLVYILTEAFSFNVSDWTGGLGSTTHTFVLPIVTSDLMGLVVVDSSLCVQLMDRQSLLVFPLIRLAAEEEEFAPHDFVTRDQFRIQVTRGMKIILSHVTSHDLPKDKRSTTASHLQTMANLLGATVLVHTEKDFFYAGHDLKIVDLEKGEWEVNYLSQDPGKVSHLLGGGTVGTTYEILSLQSHDVILYPGFSQEEEMDEGTGRQFIDLSEVVGAIRLATGTKFIPLMTSEGSDLIISLGEFSSEFPGKIRIMNGTRVAGRMDIDMGGGMMELVQEVLNRKEVRKRSIGGQGTWKFSPKPVILPAGSVSVISPEDLEEGQLITTAENLQENPEFKFIRSGEDLLLTSLGEKYTKEVTTVVLTGFFDLPPSPVEMAEAPDLPVATSETLETPFPTVTLQVGHNSIFSLNSADQSIVKQFIRVSSTDRPHEEKSKMPLEKEWDEFLEQTEINLLNSLPFPEQIKREFTVPAVTKLWRKYGTFVVSCAGLMIVVTFGLLLKRYNMEIRQWSKSVWLRLSITRVSAWGRLKLGKKRIVESVLLKEKGRDIQEDFFWEDSESEDFYGDIGIELEELEEEISPGFINDESIFGNWRRKRRENDDEF